MLSACSMVTTTPDLAYQSTVDAQNNLYDLRHWSFEGRIAIVTKHDVEQANISWSHLPSEEVIKLSGPLGQGAVLIQLNKESIIMEI